MPYSPPKVRERQFADHVEPPVPMVLVWPTLAMLVTGHLVAP